MSLNMKSGLSSPTENIPYDRKSENIKSELAKYRMLKSKGILDTNDDIKENKSLTKSNTPQTPSYQEASYRAALVLINSNSPQAVNSNNSTMKSEYWPSSSKKMHTQSNQSFYSSVQPTAESFRGSSSQRDKNTPENYYATYYSTPVAKDLQNNTNVANTRNSAAVKSPQPEAAEKKTGSRRSLITEEKQKEKAMSQIEQFVNSELEKDLIEKIQPKTTSHSSRNAQQLAPKNQTRTMKKVPSSGEIRVSSALEMSSNRTIREVKNYTPVEETKRKKSLPGSPKPFLARDSQIKKKNGPSLTNVSRERKTEIIRTTSPRCILPTKCEGDENVVQEEIEKWRIFGKMMAESYDELNKKYTEYMTEKEKDKKVIGALKDQVNTLKSLLKEAKEEKMKLSSKSTSDSSLKDDNKDLASLMKEIEDVKNENVDMKKTLEFLKEENGALQNTLEDIQKYKDLAEHYEKIAESRFKECSALAEEIICLRTDLDRSHSNYLRIQREQTSAKKSNTETFLSGKKLRLGGEQGAFLGNNNSAASHKKWSENKGQNWTEEVDDQPPTPADFTMLPSRVENIGMRG